MGQYISSVFGYGHFYGQAANIAENEIKMARRVLVTGGATVPFKELLDEVVSHEFLTTLKYHGFTHVEIQCGNYLSEIEQKFNIMNTTYDLEITIFDFESDLKTKMWDLCRGQEGVQLAGFVIGHAGTGTIADTLETGVALITVANPNLMDNHQSDFAAQTAAEHPTIIQGHLGYLSQAVPQMMAVIDQNGLDHLEPMQPGLLPVPEDVAFNFIDQLIARDL